MTRRDAPAAAVGRVPAPTRAVARGVVPRPVTSPRARSCAFAALAFGLLWGYGVGSVLAIVFGAIAIGRIRDANGWATSGGMAAVGIVLGIIGILVTVLIAKPLSVAGIM